MVIELRERIRGIKYARRSRNEKYVKYQCYLLAFFTANTIPIVAAITAAAMMIFLRINIPPFYPQPTACLAHCPDFETPIASDSDTIVIPTESMPPIRSITCVKA